ncbi:InlB B-repeat-containing protein [Aurantimicrobium minutum]|uniref:InlB B-repeat-containing protein n=1 Tax=Aurantimicrobium minutum TaxID=708131 RepID=UPI002474FD4E|nr:InlB B-repeat-containing protein [Aurantimicrobium minutum]MDH6423110.1 putative repeat protein (TIGR02543 family) [Aurantimicrobium minutum]
MTKLSFKALSAAITTLVLVVFGASLSAQAVAALTVSTTTFTTSTATPAGLNAELTGTTIQNNFDTIVIGPNSGWTNVNTCPVFGSATAGNESSCGITSVTVGGTAVTGWKAYLDSNTGPKLRLYKANAGTGFTSGQAIKVTFDAGAWTTSASAAYTTFTFTTMYNGGANLDSSTTTLTVGSPSSTVTFNSNGGSGSMANQTSSSATNLTPNAFTKSGFTFGGWASTQSFANAGTVFLANGASYDFQTSRTLYAIWTANGGGGSSASATMTLNASTGQLVAGSTVAVQASGLQATAPYTVVVQSTPQTIGSGNATAGVVNTSVTLPAGLEAGWHTLTFTSTGANGSAVTSVSYFKVSASGTLLATSSTLPAELANTGINTATGISLLAGGLSLALVGAELFMIARRKRSN